MTPPASFTELFEGERQLLNQLTGAGPLTSVEQQNWTEFSELLGDLQAHVNHPIVVDGLQKSHAKFTASFAPRLENLEARKRVLRDAIGRLRSTLQQGADASKPLAAALNAYYVNEVGAADRRVKEVGRNLSRKLNGILWRGRLKRVFFETAHAVLVLAVFTFGFSWIGDRACEWAAPILSLLQLPMPPDPASETVCRALWFDVTVLMFAIERWFLGPAIDGWVDAQLERSTEVSMGFYFAERTRLEYTMAILDHLVATMEHDLRQHGLI